MNVNCNLLCSVVYYVVKNVICVSKNYVTMIYLKDDDVDAVFLN